MEIRGILKNLCRNLHEKENEYVRHQVSEIGNMFIKIYIIFFPKQYYPLPDVTYMSESIGERLKELRKTHNFTQKQVANYLGFKQSQIDCLENSKETLKSSSLNRLCELYNCTPEYILNGTGDYSKEYELKLDENMDLNTFAAMNRIIRNLNEVIEINNQN